MPVRVAINGFGRIGRGVLRAAHERDADLEIVAVNDLVDPNTLAHLLRYDSVFGRFPAPVAAADGAIEVDGRAVRTLAETDPTKLPWAELEVDVVIESTGRFRDARGCGQAPRGRGEQGDHLGAGEGRRTRGRDRGAGRELRRGLRPRQPPRHLQRLVHDELPGARVEGAARGDRHQAWSDDDRPRLHRRSEPPRRSAQ